MGQLFKNPEFRRSSLFLLVSFLVFLVISYMVILHIVERDKTTYVENNGAMIGLILKTNPQLEDEIIPLAIKGLDEEAKKLGLEVLRTYGYDDTLATTLLPEVVEKKQSLIFSFFGILTIVFLMMFILYSVQSKRLYLKMNELTKMANEVLEGRFYQIEQENEEGELAKLTYSFNNMSTVIRNQMLSLQNEKQFLMQLLTDISHQLKTPLASLMMFNELLSEKDMEQAQRNKFLQSSQIQLRRMEWLIKSLLKLAKLDAGAITFKKLPQSLNETILHSLDLIKRQADDKNIEVKLHIEDEIKMVHDREWLSEALINMMKNAIEHTQSGGNIIVSAKKAQLFYHISIADSGEGIDSEQLPHIFERFYRANKQQQSDSVGIGLSLSKSIIEGQGGMIEVKSEKGYGTRFEILFPKYN